MSLKHPAKPSYNWRCEALAMASIAAAELVLLVLIWWMVRSQ